MYTLRIVNRLSSDPGSMVDVPLSCGKVRAYIAAWTVRLVTGKSVAVMQAAGHTLATILFLEA